MNKTQEPQTIEYDEPQVPHIVPIFKVRRYGRLVLRHEVRKYTIVGFKLLARGTYSVLRDVKYGIDDIMEQETARQLRIKQLAEK